MSCYFQEMVSWLSDKATSLSLEDCGRDEQLYLETRGMLHLAVTEVSESFAWVNEPPYLFVNADRPEVAQCYLDKVRGVPPVDQHPVVRYHLEKFGAALRAIARGDMTAIDDGFLQERDVFRRMAITSDPAEGYHRSISATKSRARSAGMPFLLSSNRLQQNISLCERLLKDDAGRTAFRYNFKKYQRILQTSRRKQYRPVRQVRKLTLAKVYRLERESRQDWSGLATEVEGPEAPAGPAPAAPDTTKLATEWLRAVFKANTIYSFPSEPGDQTEYFSKYCK